MYPDRYFRVRHARPFDDPALAVLLRGYRAWQDWVTARIALWREKGPRGTPVPFYEFAEPEVSLDRRLVTFCIRGDPGSYGALKLFEDGVPAELWGELPSELLTDLEVSYENPRFGLRGDDWHKAQSEGAPL